MTTMRFDRGDALGQTDPLAEAVGRLRSSVLDRRLGDVLHELKRTSDERERRTIAMSREPSAGLAPDLREPVEKIVDSSLVQAAKKLRAEQDARHSRFVGEQQADTLRRAGVANELEKIAERIGAYDGFPKSAHELAQNILAALADSQRRALAAHKLGLRSVTEVEGALLPAVAKITETIGVDAHGNGAALLGRIAEHVRSWPAESYMDLMI